MNEFAASSVFFGVFVTLAAYFLGLKVKEKTGLAIMNPLLIAIVLVMLLLRGLDIDYAAYNQSARLVSSLLTPRRSASPCRSMSSCSCLSATRQQFSPA